MDYLKANRGSRWHFNAGARPNRIPRPSSKRLACLRAHLSRHGESDRDGRHCRWHQEATVAPLGIAETSSSSTHSCRSRRPSWAPLRTFGKYRMNHLYHFPVLSSQDFGFVRSPGPGFGNLLFPIARALAGQRAIGGVFVYPTIPQFKLGTYIRRERDKRTYSGELRARTLREWKDWWLARNSILRYSETEPVSQKLEGTVLYAGLADCFQSLDSAGELVGNWLDSNACYRGRVSDKYDIGLHVRLGDFSSNASAGNGPATRQSMDWYRMAVERARSLTSGQKSRILLFTDDEPEKVREVLKISNIAIDPSANAVTAIRNLSDASCIITSRSTFSMWAAYIGDTTALWHTSFEKSDIFPTRKGKDFLV